MKKFIEMHNDDTCTSIFSPIRIIVSKEFGLITIDCKYFNFSLPNIMKNDIDTVLEFIVSKMNKRLTKEHRITTVQDVFEVEVGTEIKYFLPLYHADSNRAYLYEIVNGHYTTYRKWISYNDIVNAKPKELLKQLLQLNGIKYEEF